MNSISIHAAQVIQVRPGCIPVLTRTFTSAEGQMIGCEGALSYIHFWDGSNGTSADLTFFVSINGTVYTVPAHGVLSSEAAPAYPPAPDQTSPDSILTAWLANRPELVVESGNVWGDIVITNPSTTDPLRLGIWIDGDASAWRAFDTTSQDGVTVNPTFTTVLPSGRSGFYACLAPMSCTPTAYRLPLSAPLTDSQGNTLNGFFNTTHLVMTYQVAGMTKTVTYANPAIANGTSEYWFSAVNGLLQSNPGLNHALQVIPDPVTEGRKLSGFAAAPDFTGNGGNITILPTDMSQYSGESYIDVYSILNNGQDSFNPYVIHSCVSGLDCAADAFEWNSLPSTNGFPWAQKYVITGHINNNPPVQVTVDLTTLGANPDSNVQLIFNALNGQIPMTGAVAVNLFGQGNSIQYFNFTDQSDTDFVVALFGRDDFNTASGLNSEPITFTLSPTPNDLIPSGYLDFASLIHITQATTWHSCGYIEAE